MVCAINDSLNDRTSTASYYFFDVNFSYKRKGEIYFHAARSVKDMFFIETARSSHFQHTLDLDHQEIERQQTGLTNTAA